MGRKLGLEVVAEGVETHAQRDFLLAEGCREAQGFCFGRPGSSEALAELLLLGNEHIAGSPRQPATATGEIPLVLAASSVFPAARRSWLTPEPAHI